MAQARNTTKSTPATAESEGEQHAVDETAAPTSGEQPSTPTASELAEAGKLSEEDVEKIATRVVAEFALTEPNPDPIVEPRSYSESVVLTREVGGHQVGDTITVTPGAAEYLHEQGYTDAE